MPGPDPAALAIVSIANTAAAKYELASVPVLVTAVGASEQLWYARVALASQPTRGMHKLQAWGSTKLDALRVLQRLVGAEPVDEPASPPGAPANALDQLEILTHRLHALKCVAQQYGTGFKFDIELDSLGNFVLNNFKPNGSFTSNGAV